MIEYKYTIAEVEKMQKCEKEVQEALAKYGCELHYTQIVKNGVVIQSQFSAEIKKDGISGTG